MSPVNPVKRRKTQEEFCKATEVRPVQDAGGRRGVQEARGTVLSSHLHGILEAIHLSDSKGV